MEVQVQGSVLVNGEWVSRTADVYQIMARNQQQEDTEMQEPESDLPTPVPELGILSRTVIESSFNSLVLPANIRHKELNDVLIVGEDSVQLKEICDYGHLRHIADKSDFKGKILAARVFGEPRKVQVNTSEPSPLLKHASVHRGRRSGTGEEEASLPPEVIVLTLSSRTLMFLWASHTQVGPVTLRQKSIRLPSGSSRFDRPGPFLAVDPRCRAIAVAAHEGFFVIYKTKTMDKWREQIRAGHDQVPIEDEALIQIEGRVMHMEFLSSGGMQDDAHVVLVFIVVHDGKPKVVCYEWDFRLGLDDNSVRKDRSHVDHEDQNPSLLIPLSRSADFLLVCDSHISLYKRVLSGPPSREKSDFHEHILAPLRPGAGKGTPRWVQWDKAPRHPDFAKEAFYIAREDGMVVYVERGQMDTLGISEAGRWPYPIDTAFACLNVDNSEFAHSYPDVLISGGIGSDGHLCRVGAWPKEYTYALPASETHVFSALESIPNWTPLTDMAITRLSEPQSPDTRDRAGIYVASGEAPHGQISELRRGLKALVQESFEGMKGCTGVYIVDRGRGRRAHHHEANETKQDYVTFVVAFPLESLVIRAVRTLFDGSSSQHEPGVAWDGGTWEITELPLPTNIPEYQAGRSEENIMGAIRDEETISACAWNDKYAVQITRTKGKILHRPVLDTEDSWTFPHPLLQAATVPGNKFIAVTFRKENQAVLKLVRILEDGKFSRFQYQNPEYLLPCDPTCLELSIHYGVAHVFVGTIDSGVLLFLVQLDEDEAGWLSRPPVIEARLESRTASEVRMVCESAVLLTTKDGPQLVCGTRNGFIVSMTLERRPEGYGVLFTHLTRMGTTAVLISPCATDSSSAFVACGPDFCRLRATSRNHPPIDIDSVWLVDPRKPAYMQGPLAAIDQLAFLTGTDTGTDLSGFMLAVSGEQMVFAQLDSDRRWSSHDIPSPILEKGKVIPRSLATTTTPKRLTYLEQMTTGLHRLAVATVDIKEERAPPNAYRVMHSSIKLISLYDEQAAEDVDIKEEDEASSALNKLVTAEFALKHYERVYSMIEWTYPDDRGHKYHFIIVGTGVTEALGNESGRRLFFKAGKSGLKLQKETTYRDGPMRCMAVYDTKQIVTIIGKTLQLEEYDPSEGRWIKKGTTELPSAGVHLTVHEPYIFVSTTHDSHICYCLVPFPIQQGHAEVGFVTVYNDARQRHATHHMVYNLPEKALPGLNEADAGSRRLYHDTVVLLADKTCSLTGLLHSTVSSHKATTDTLFEACLPRSVIRIHRGDVRPPWRRPYNDPFAPFNGIAGILADDILGACSDGTIYSFSILSKSARRLLRLIQNIIEAKQKRDPALQYSTIKHRSSDLFRVLQNGAEGAQESKIKARDVDPEAQEKGDAAPRFNHVDGDLIVRFLDEDGDLDRLVRDGCDEDVAGLFSTNLGILLAEGEKEEKLKIESKTMSEWASIWVGNVLMPLL